MKKVSLFLLSLSAVFAFVGCNTHKDDFNTTRWASYGELLRNDDGSSDRIITDGGAHLYIVSSSLSNEAIKKHNDRVLVSYTILDEKPQISAPEGYDIHLNGFYELLAKKPEIASEMDDEDIEEVGSDPIHVDESFFGGNYLNIKFAIQHTPWANISHRISLVYDDVNSTDELTIVKLHHNGYGTSEGGYIGKGLVSFRLVDIIPEGAETANIKLLWDWFDKDGEVVEFSDEGVFKPFGPLSPKAAETYGFQPTVVAE